MRSLAFAALFLALAGCGRGGDADQLATSKSNLSAAQIDAALGPADPSVQDKFGTPVDNALANDAAEMTDNAASGEERQ